MWAQVGSTCNKRPPIERRCDPKCVQPTMKDHQQLQFDTSSTCNILKWPNFPGLTFNKKKPTSMSREFNDWKQWRLTWNVWWRAIENNEKQQRPSQKVTRSCHQLHLLKLAHACQHTNQEWRKWENQGILKIPLECKVETHKTFDWWHL